MKQFEVKSKRKLLVTLMDIYKEYQIKFDAFPTSFGGEMLSFISLNKYVMFRLGFRQDGLLIITTYEKGEVLLKSNDVCRLNTSIAIEIRQVKQKMKYIFSVYVNGSNVYDALYDQVEEYRKVGNYIGDNYVFPLGFVKNMLISGKNDGILLLINTNCFVRILHIRTGFIYIYIYTRLVDGLTKNHRECDKGKFGEDYMLEMPRKPLCPNFH